ncbi:MAG: DUF2851 family protein [Saprospiraceae bacterium]|nr:DUF2851 family protein [Saprospiraceae bacterium]
MLTDSPFKEEFLHYLWRTKKLPLHHYQTTEGHTLDIIDFGTYNTDSGPDFFNGKINIDGTIWAGNIEMHVFSSDWLKHKHQYDAAYENVILHVVYENDIPVSSSHTLIPTLELKGKIPKSYINNYLNLIQSTNKIPCQHLISNVDKGKINLWKYTLTVERLENKSSLVNEIFTESRGDWEETLYIMLAKYFGSKVNKEPFEQLARSLPLSIIHKNKNNRTAFESLFFGQAGMLLADYKDDYFVKLKSEFQYQQKKYKLKPINPVSWKFSKLRPVNFPTIRIAQFVGLMYGVTFLFSRIREAERPEEIKKMLQSNVDEYWLTHYKFGTTSALKSKRIGEDFMNVLLINTIAPLLFCYGKFIGEDKYKEMAISILEDIPGENNAIIRLWKSLEITSSSAFDSQALIQLKSMYCDQYKCLSCKIGNELINMSSE